MEPKTLSGAQPEAAAAAKAAELERQQARDRLFRERLAALTAPRKGPPSLEAAAAEAKRQESEREYNRAMAERRWKELGVPARLFDVFRDGPAPTEAIQSVVDFLAVDQLGRFAGKHYFLVLCGSVGVGKTIAAWWGIHLRGGVGQKAKVLQSAGFEAGPMWEALARAKVALIDDLGVEQIFQNGPFLGDLQLLLDRRYDAARPTILTTNLAPAAFLERYCPGEQDPNKNRTLDRFVERGRFCVLEGESRRRAPEGA